MKISNTAKLIIIFVLMGAVLAFGLWYAYDRASREAQDASPDVATDAFGQGIIDRWGAGLPAGYDGDGVTSCGSLDGAAFAAVLRYEDSVEDVLTNWYAPTEGILHDYRDILHLIIPADEEEQAVWNTMTTAAPDEGWLCYMMEKDGRKLVLLYERSSMAMYIAESL